MSKDKNTDKFMDNFEWYEPIRFRPGMFMGQVNIRGFINILLENIFSNLILETQTTLIALELITPLSGKLVINNIQNPITNFWSCYKNKNGLLLLELQTLNAFSAHFSINLFDNDTIHNEVFEKGILIEKNYALESISCTKIEVDFTLDAEIWKDDFKLNPIFIAHEINEFAYLYKNTQFELKYIQGNEPCRIVYHFPNGLADKITMQQLKGLGSVYFATSISEQIGDYYLEAAFAFKDYTVDATYLQSYVNDHLTHEHGTHVDALLQGLTYGVMKYFQAQGFTTEYKISEKGIQANLIAAINIRMEQPNFSGCVRNKLANSALIAPISNYIATLFFEKIKQDEVSTQKLIQLFKV